MPSAAYPSLEWYEYHLKRQEWRKALKDIIELHVAEMISKPEFSELTYRLAVAIKATR